MLEMTSPGCGWPASATVRGGAGPRSQGRALLATDVPGQQRKTVDYLKHERTVPNRRANVDPDQTCMGIRSCSGGAPTSRHLSDSHPQVLIIARAWMPPNSERLMVTQTMKAQATGH
jgi:hypothetical protein